jgi:hypothetical protein
LTKVLIFILAIDYFRSQRITFATGIETFAVKSQYMKLTRITRFFALVLLVVFQSCSDGNLDISSFEFEETVNVCGSYTLYRLSTNGQKEALIVTLTAQQIRQDGEPVIPVTVSSTGLYSVTDRVFDDQVTSSYFCATVPPVEPNVVKNWEGVSGLILVENRPVYDEDGITIVAWEHIIVLNDVVLESGEEKLIFNDTFLYGTFETSPEL